MADPTDDLFIRFPARSGYLAISRLNATALAANGGFDVEELDDLRLAVGEAVTWLLTGADHRVDDGVDHRVDDGADQGVDHEPVDAVELSIGCRDGSLRFRGRRTSPTDGSGDAPELGDLAEAILGATVDRYETGLDDRGRRYLVLVKQTLHHG